MAVPRGKAIEAMRVKRGEKRSDFAKRVGISYKHLHGIECGRHGAARETLHRIADALVVDVSLVMAADGEMSEKKKREANPTTHPEPKRPVPPPPAKRKKGSEASSDLQQAS